jgi:hypothetical protein
MPHLEIKFYPVPISSSIHITQNNFRDSVITCRLPSICITPLYKSQRAGVTAVYIGKTASCHITVSAI